MSRQPHPTVTVAPTGPAGPGSRGHSARLVVTSAACAALMVLAPALLSVRKAQR